MLMRTRTRKRTRHKTATPLAEPTRCTWSFHNNSFLMGFATTSDFQFNNLGDAMDKCVYMGALCGGVTQVYVPHPDWDLRLFSDNRRA